MGRVAASGHNFRIMPGALGRGATTNNSVAEVASTQFTMPMISPRSPGAIWHAVSADRRSLLTWQEGSEDIQVLATGVNLRRPQVLRDHSIMTFSDTDPTLIVVGSDGARMSTVVDLGGRRVTSFSVAPDAIRVALVLERGKTRALGIGLLSRQEGAVHLSHITDIPLSSSDVNLSIITDVAWLSQTRLCVLGRAIDAGVTTPYEIVVDGSGATSMGQLTATSMAAVVALPTEMGTEAVVLCEDGTLLLHEESFRWRQILQGVNAVAVTA